MTGEIIYAQSGSLSSQYCGDEMPAKNTALEERVDWHARLFKGAVAAALVLFGIIYGQVFYRMPRTEDIENSVTRDFNPLMKKSRT